MCLFFFRLTVIFENCFERSINDYTFKRLFGHKGNEEITKGLLSIILQKKINEIDLDKNKILEKDLLTEKIGVLDVRAIIDGDVNCDIEVQIVDYKDIQERILLE